jgi:hypothetical protein
LLLRPYPLGRKEVPRDADACHLRQAVEHATQALAAAENAQHECLRKQLELALHHRQHYKAAASVFPLLGMR